MTSTLAPQPFNSLGENDPCWQEAELKELKMLQDAGLELAPLLVVPAALEEHFYRLNNLPEQLRELFARINPKNPDEDDIEDLTPSAQAIIKRHYLLDEMIDTVYDTLESLPERITVRRAGEAGQTVLKGRPTLMALKDLWAASWSFEAVMKRLETKQTIALEARTALLHAESAGTASLELTKQASELLGQAVELEVSEAGGITRVK